MIKLPAVRQRRVWVAVASVLVAAAAAALVPPPSALGDFDEAGRSFAALASAATVGLSILPFVLWRGPARPLIWLAAAVAALALGMGTFTFSGSTQRACTAQYAGRSIVVGTELTPLGATYHRENPELSRDDLLFDAAGAPERIWTRESIGRCRTLVAGTYFLWIPFLVVCLLATAQAVPATRLTPVRWDAPAPAPATATPPRYDVFLSYRHDPVDSRFALDILHALEADGYRVAIDERDFLANASFLQEMERCIRESRFTVAVISPRYFNSGNTEEEAIVSKVLDMGDRKRRLIPVVIEPVAMPAWLYGIVGIDCTKSDPLVDPIDKLKAALGAPLNA
jgi:hypothetical protein